MLTTFIIYFVLSPFGDFFYFSAIITPFNAGLLLPLCEDRHGAGEQLTEERVQSVTVCRVSSFSPSGGGRCYQIMRERLGNVYGSPGEDHAGERLQLLLVSLRVSVRLPRDLCSTFSPSGSGDLKQHFIPFNACKILPENRISYALGAAVLALFQGVQVNHSYIYILVP